MCNCCEENNKKYLTIIVSDVEAVTIEVGNFKCTGRDNYMVG